MHNGDYPGQAFFGVFKGRKQRVESTYNQLLENVQDYPGAVYEAFMNRAHATQFSKTGRVPEGAVPVKPVESKPLVNGTPFKFNITAALHGTPVRNASTSSSAREVKVWTDGSCLGNGKAGATAAYAVYFGPDDRRNEAKRVPGMQTNNNGEIFAVIRALEIVDEGAKHLTIYTDSKYTIECLTWLPGWRKRGGMNSSNKPAAHYPMVKYMDALIQRRGNRFELVHVRAHQDNEGNNAADLMARQAAKELDIPPRRDWELECVKLQKKPLVDVTGSPKITVASGQVKAEPDDGSDYGYSDLELDGAEIDDVDFGNPSDRSVNTRDTSLSADDKPAAGKKRSRDVPDSDGEREGAKKKAKEQAVKCPNCRHKFNITLRK
ncbi:unnamed protein product [Rhizoctonia solani]|uniref:ribonuclease H n=1 Tax=Rhizoctonia solani TaxID=456999 RepID=A0A8H3BRM3_9AGAM|nr:unnamed protein product [Rhizoctonia solani]